MMRNDDSRVVRYGYISSFDSESGMAAIYYPDRNDQVTQMLPIVCPFGLAQFFSAGDPVLVVHLSNGKSAGIVIGKTASSGASIRESNGDIIFSGTAGVITLSEIIQLKKKL